MNNFFAYKIKENIISIINKAKIIFVIILGILLTNLLILGSIIESKTPIWTLRYMGMRLNIVLMV